MSENLSAKFQQALSHPVDPMDLADALECVIYDKRGPSKRDNEAQRRTNVDVPETYIDSLDVSTSTSNSEERISLWRRFCSGCMCVSNQTDP